jgi:nucleotide-binding universal stress UspA family protein
MAQNAVARWSNPELILVATNLLEGKTLIQHAIFQAQLTKAKVILAHVVLPSNSRANVPERTTISLLDPSIRAAKTKLEEMAIEFQHEGVLCEPIVLTGHPAEQIAQLAKSRAADRVMVATRFSAGVARLVEPSIAEELTLAIDIPVCIIGRRAHPAAAFGTSLGGILLATSLHSGNSLLASFASSLAELNHAQLTLLHVLENEEMSQQQREIARLVARRRLAALVPDEARYTRPVFLVCEGDPATEILDKACSMSQEIIILGSPHPSMFPRSLTNSVVHHVALESQCPVIAIKPSLISSAKEIHELTSVKAL